MERIVYPAERFWECQLLRQNDVSRVNFGPSPSLTRSPRHSSQFSIDFDIQSFCDRYAYADTVGQDPLERINAVLTDYGLSEAGAGGIGDYVIGHECVWLSFAAFKTLEDPLRAAEKERRKIARGLAGRDRDETDSVLDGDDVSIMNNPVDSLSPRPLGQGDMGESSDNLLLRRTYTGQSGPFGDSAAASLPFARIRRRGPAYTDFPLAQHCEWTVCRS